MIKRILKYTGLCFLLLVLLVVGGLSWLIGTEKGFQQTLALAGKYAPGEFSWDQADGKLAGPLRIKGLHYLQVDAIEAKVGELKFDWHPTALFSTEVAIEQLLLDDVELHLPEVADTDADVSESSTDGVLPDISLPVSITLKDIAVNNVSIYPAGQDTPIEIDRVALTGTAQQSDVHLEFLEVIAPQGELRLEGDVKTRDDYPMDLTLGWRADIGQSAPLQGEGKLEGSLLELQIDHQVKGFAMADIEATISNVIQSPEWKASIDGSLPDAGSLSALLTGTPQFSLQTSGTPDEYQAQATVNVATTETGPVTVNADLGGSSEVLDIHSLEARMSENGGEFSAAGQLTFASLYSDIQGQWQGLSWPVLTDPQFSSNTGSYAIKGSPDDFKARVSTEVDGADIPSGQWDVSLDGSATALNNFVVLGHTLDGTIVAIGSASWETQPYWDVELVTEGINPGSQWADFSGSINLEVSSEGRISEDGPQLNAEIKRLSGRFRDQPLSGKGLIRLVGERVNIEQLNVTHGKSVLLANGEIDNQIALDFELVSPDLSTLLPELTGAIGVAGTVSGSKDAPKLNVSGNADNVAYTGNSVSTLKFSIDAGLAANDHSTLSFDASGIAAGGQKISDISLSAEGSQLNHRIVLSTDTDQGGLGTQLEGSYQNDTWNGNLSSLELDNTAAGDWHLREPVAITANAQEADASTLCLDNGDKLGSLCVAASWLAVGESTVTAKISGLSPRLVRDYLPAGIIVDTELNGDINASLGSDGALNADASLAFTPGKLIVESGNTPINIGLEKTTIDASLRGDDVMLELATAFTDLGTLNVQASLSDPASEGRLAGKLNADFQDLSLISAFVPQIQQVSGGLKSKLSMGGTVQTPLIEGELALLDFSAEIPETAMVIKDTQLRVKGNPDGTLLINGESRSGDGYLKIKGRVNPATRAIELNLNGDQFEVANSTMMQAVISPQLSIGMDDKGMRVSGKVTIPRAYINANGGSEGIQTVSSSSDVVYVSEEGEQEEAPASQLDLDVQIILGDSVEVEAGDFRGKLEGDLRIQQTPELAPLGTGTINVLNGDYVIYGQQLNMERGRILFSGGPVDNPSLDMEVARTVQEYDVVAGAKIQGTVQTPRLELYSEPPMPDASILSYILLGQPPGTTGGSYTLGKYLTPELYVSYGIGLFDAINTFNMRYKLTDKLAVEAESGSGSSADLIYTIEK